MIEALHGVFPFEALAQAPGLLCEVEACIPAANGRSWRPPTPRGKRPKSPPGAAIRSASAISAAGSSSTTSGERRRRNGGRPRFSAPVGTAPWRKVELRDIPLPAPLLPVRPASPGGSGAERRIHGQHRSRGRFELPRPAWDTQGAWLRRLQTERLRRDATAAVNPAGVTGKGGGDTLLTGDNASVTYDLGLGYVGFIGIEATGHAGQVLDIAWSERLADDGEVRPRQPTQFNSAIQVTLREGRQSFLAFMPQFVRFVRVAQRGPGQVTLHRLWLTEFRFVAEPKGNFRCSDEQLNRVYDAARRTAMLVTLDAYMDCPHRERNAMYASEAYSDLKAVYPMFGDTSVSRRSILYGVESMEDPERIGPPGLVQIAYPMHLRQFNCVIPAGPLVWVQHMGLYQQYSGDTELVRGLIPVMRRNLAAFDLCRNSDGLIESFPAGVSALLAVLRLGRSAHRRRFDCPERLFMKTLDDAARLERMAGDAAHAEALAKEADRVRAAINRYCPGENTIPDVLLTERKERVGRFAEASETTQYHVMWAGIPSPAANAADVACPAR